MTHKTSEWVKSLERVLFFASDYLTLQDSDKISDKELKEARAKLIQAVNSVGKYDK